MKTIGVFQLNQKKFDLLPFTGHWAATMGEPEANFSCIIYGNSGDGKTTFTVQLVKYLCTLDLKVGYVSEEEGISATMQKAFQRVNMHEVSGKITLIEQATYDDIIGYFKKRGSPDVLVLDSLDYLSITKAQYQELRAALKNKIIIMLSWATGRKPLTQAARDIEYMVGVKLLVKQYIVYPRSRFGGNQPFVVWPERARLLNPEFFAKLDKQKQQGIIPFKPAENGDIEQKEGAKAGG